MINSGYLYLLLIFLYNHDCNALLSCKDENNKDVDWFIILKLPASYNYFYLSSESQGGKWEIPSYALNNKNNFLALTLNQVYNADKSNSFYALYNDDKPRIYKTQRSKGGHLKGVVNFNTKSGYWLVHSVPKFPNKNKYDYSNGESMNGQSFLCVSLDFQNIKPIADQLLMMYANVYRFNLPSNFTSDSDLTNKLFRLVMNEHNPGTKFDRKNMATLKKIPLYHFGKSEAYFKDIYLDVIAPGLNTSLYVESWMKSEGDKMRSDCQTKNKVYNVRKVSINGVDYSETIDHSKWAVSNLQSQPLVCIGDLNRMVDQKKRGGGSLCISDPSIWKAFSTIVKEYEQCPKFDFIL